MSAAREDLSPPDHHQSRRDARTGDDGDVSDELQNDGMTEPVREQRAVPAVIVPHNRLTHGPEEVAAVARAVASGRWAMGPEVGAFEQELAALAGRAHARTVGSGTAALRLGLAALGVGPGHEVIVPAYGCVALANAVLALGATPVATDVDPAAWTLAVDAARARLTPRTRAIVAVHTFGAPAPIADLARLGVPVVEDCAHGLGPIAMGAHYGAQGTIAVSSFHATKLIATGEGGAVMTEEAALAARITALRDGADQPPSGFQNDKMNELEAALGRVQVRRLPEMLARRAELALRYEKALAPLAANGRISLPTSRPDRVWYRYVIEPGEPLADVQERLLGHGIATASPVWNWHDGTLAERCPIAERAFARVLSLPLYPSLTDEEQESVVAALTAVLGSSEPPT